jgi:hypothetical protein
MLKLKFVKSSDKLAVEFNFSLGLFAVLVAALKYLGG